MQHYCTYSDLDTVSVVNVRMKSETWNNSIKIASANHVIITEVKKINFIPLSWTRKQNIKLFQMPGDLDSQL